MTASRRHLLVIATQCESMEQLDQLKPAAQNLAEVLLDPEVGECVPGLSDGRALCLGPLDCAAIRVLVTEALEHAREHDATLVLALLGHGFTVHGTSTLFYMGQDSQEDIANSAVEVNGLLRNAVWHPRVDGVVAVIDTCHAGAALPDSGDLVAGEKRLGVLMASNATEPASDLRLSAKLADLLRSGLDTDDSRIRLDDAADDLQKNIPGQKIGHSVHHGDHLTPSALWLGANRRATARQASDFIGPLGRERLNEARSAYRAGAACPDHLWDDSRLFGVRRALLQQARSLADDRLLNVLTKLDAASKTIELLRSVPELTTDRLRRALNALLAAEDQLSSTKTLALDLVAVVDYVVFNHPAADSGHRRWVTRFVALVTTEDPKSDDTRLDEWASRIGAETQLADAREFARARNREHQLRLVVSAHSWAGDWPEKLETWLLVNGEMPAPGDSDFRSSFQCPTVDGEGADQALALAVAWGQSTARRLGLGLRQVDIAAPAWVLLQWRPEEAVVGGEWLGVGYSVTTHWSPRFDPPAEVLGTADIAMRRLEKIEAAADRLVWLADHETCKPETIRGHMVSGRYQRAIAVEHRLGIENTRLVDVLCSYVPIVLWWCHPKSGIRQSERAGIEEHWNELPFGILKAYRERWNGTADHCLADFRALWDDREWLAFCRKLAGI